ncbi:MAG TPA: MFS transporter, partial [Polyangiaceae bacterium]
ENRRPFSLLRSNSIGALRKLGRDATTFGLAGCLFLLQVAQMMVQGTWALYHQARFGWSLRSVGLSLMVAGLAIALVQGGLVRPVTQRVGERAAVIVGLLFNLASDLAFAFADRSWLVYAILFPLAFGGLVGPAVQAILTRASTATEQGELQGSINSLSGVAAICGPLFGTTLLARFPVGPGHPGAVFLAAAMVTLVGLGLAIPSRAPRPLTTRE